MTILEDVSCGLDVGTSSVGAALINGKAKVILPFEDGYAAWVWKFDPVEEKAQNKWKSKSGERGVYRRTRNRLGRKAWRLGAIRRLFKEYGLTASNEAEALFPPNAKGRKSPWELRQDALTRRLSGEELFRALYHIAGHRAYEANSKAGEEEELRQLGDNIEEKKARKKSEKAESHAAQLKSLTEAVAQSGTTAADYFRKTFGPEGRLRAEDQKDGRLRGRNGRHDRLIKRWLLKKEVDEIFKAQRNLGNNAASEDLQRAYWGYASHLKIGQDSERFVGPCPFAVDDEGKPLRRAPRFAPSYERFRFLQKLANTRLADGFPLSAEQRRQALEGFGDHPSYTWAMLGQALGVDPAAGFKDAPKDPERDFVMARGECAKGTVALRDALTGFEPPVETLDLVARKLTHHADLRSIEKALAGCGLPPPILDRAVEQARLGAFKFFKGAGFVSLEAARRLAKRFLEGDDYKEACAFYDWDHAKPENMAFSGLARPAKLKDVLAIINDPEKTPIAAPGARKTIIQALKQFGAIVQEFKGLPGRVNIELAREVGKSAEARNKLDLQNNANAAENRRLEKLFREQIGREARAGSEDLLRFKLWREQQGRCPYRYGRYGDHRGYISPQILQDDLDCQELAIDHVLPWSWSKDNSYNNLVLCFSTENARKADRVPWEYFRDEMPHRWSNFKAWIEMLPSLKEAEEAKKGEKPEREICCPECPPLEELVGVGGYKKRNLLVEGEEAITKFKERVPKRHLNDTRYATRILMQAITAMYPYEETVDRDGEVHEKRRVFARPAQLTKPLRQAWQVDHLKYGKDRKKLKDERNHAVDALVVAAITNRHLQDLTDQYQKQERAGGGMGRGLSGAKPPWDAFMKDVTAARDGVLVARSERRRGRGKLHDATIYGGGPDARSGKFHSKISIQKEFGLKNGKFDRRTALRQLRAIKDRERNKHIRRSILEWLRSGARREEGKWPKDQRGQEIRRITLHENRKPGVLVHGGDADRGDIVRVDVFTKPKGGGKDIFYLVPIYPHQVADREGYPEPPMRAVVAKKSENYWTKIDESFIFRFSLYHGSYVEVTCTDSAVVEGYLVGGVDRDDGRIRLATHFNLSAAKRVSTKNSLIDMKKYNVDRFGRRAEVKSEVRTWHGEACTSPIPPG